MKKSKLTLFLAIILCALLFVFPVCASELQESVTESETQAQSESQIEFETEALIESENNLDLGISTTALTPEDDTNIEAFVRRLYETLLYRAPDEHGFNDWTTKLSQQSTTATDIIVGFIHSEEMKNANLSNNDYVDTLYRAFFDREPDAAGKADWMNALECGLSRDYVCAGFLGSSEFHKLCARYEIIPGGLKVSGILDTNPEVTRFVGRLYSKILSRTPDQGGLEYWVNALVNEGQTAAYTIEGFFYSDEFKALDLSNEAYIDICYYTLLDRGPDASGKQYWMDIADYGVSQAHILYNFVGSQEFDSMCNDYGITRGFVKLYEARDYNRDVTHFIKLSYPGAFNRNASVDDLNHWASELNGHKHTGASYVRALMLSDEISSLDLSNEEFVARSYATALLRTASESEIAAGAALITSDSKEAFLTSLLDSDEFASICNTYTLLSAREGWNQVLQNWYYVENGMSVSGWKRIDGQLYYFDPNLYNYRVTGWNYIDGLKYYFNSDGTLNQNVENIIGPQSKYLVKVNTVMNVVSIYAQDGANGYIIPVKNMICSTGAYGHGTVQGQFTIRRYALWGLLMDGVSGQYLSQIYNDYLFHSCWYYTYGDRYSLSISEFNKLGTNASHGCVRLKVSDAKWIFDNCNGSTVIVYGSGNMDNMFDKPARPSAVPLGNDRGYDPSDPNI